MAMEAFEEDIARPFGVAPRGTPAGPRLIAILKPRDTSWVVPKVSKYTFYVYGPGGNGQGGGFARKTISLPKGIVIASSINFGAVAGDGVIELTGYTATTLSGGGLAISVLGTEVTGGDLNVPGTSSFSGGDGSLFGGFYGMITAGGGGPITYGLTPGGPMQNSTYGRGGSGEIRIVDETP